MNICDECNEAIDKKTQGQIQLSRVNKEGKNYYVFYHYKPNCSGIVKNKK